MNQPYQPSDALVLDVFSDEYDIPFYAVATSGVTDSNAPYRLRDSTVDFLKLGIKEGMTVWNTSDLVPAKVVSVISPSELEIDSDIFPFCCSNYKIFSSPNPGALFWVAEETAAVRVTTYGGDTVLFMNVPRNQIIPVRISRVWLSGTTATQPNIIALW